MARGSKPGEHRGGRKPGVPNKVTAEVKAALTQAFVELGGVPAFVKWGKKYPTEFFKLWIKLLPTEIANAGAQPFLLQLVEEIVDADPAEGGPPAPGPAQLPA